MVEQRRVRRERQRHKRPRQEDQGITPGSGDTFGEAEERVARLDAAIDDILDNTPPAGPSLVAGEQDRHDVRQLSDEELWQHFRQEEGE